MLDVCVNNDDKMFNVNNIRKVDILYYTRLYNNILYISTLY